jgi:putative transposase
MVVCHGDCHCDADGPYEQRASSPGNAGEGRRPGAGGCWRSQRCYTAPRAKIGGMDRQTLRDWVIRFNEQGLDGLINKSSPGAPGKLTPQHKAFLARLVEDGPIPAVHGVVRWRLRADHAALRRVRYLGPGRYRLPGLEGLGLLSCERPAQGLQAGRRRHGSVQKTFPPAWRRSARSLRPALRSRCGARTRCGSARRTGSPIAGPGKARVPAPLNDQRTQSTYLFGAVCPERGTDAALVLPACNTEAMHRAITWTSETNSLGRGYPWQNLKPALSASAPEPDVLESTPASTTFR